VNVKCVFNFLCNFFLKHLSFEKQFSDQLSELYLRLRVKYPLILSDLNGTWIFYTNFRTIVYSNIEFHENLPRRSRVVPCVRTDRRDEANSRFPHYFESFQKYGMSSWTEFGWFRKRTMAGSFEHGIDPWGSLRDGSFLSDFWLRAILGVSFETGAGIYSGYLSQLPLGLLCCKRPQGIP
jgi:hypothetical protein